MTIFLTRKIREAQAADAATILLLSHNLDSNRSLIQVLETKVKERDALLVQLRGETEFLKEQLRQRDLLETMRAQQMPVGKSQAREVGGLDLFIEDEEAVAEIHAKYKDAEPGELE
jgi:hypothetical protein